MDFINTFYWWLILFVIGVAGLPLTLVFFRKFFDLGYGVSKTLGIVAISYIIFVFSSLKILPLTRLALFFVVFLYVLINTAIFLREKKAQVVILRKKIKIILLSESLFLLGLIAWAYVRAHQPDIRGLEKFMDYGFINSILRSKFLPPMDMWYAGKSINYYWFGHLVTAVLTKLSGLSAAITYNLMLATILGLVLSTAFSISTTLVEKCQPIKNIRAIIIGGILTAFLLGLGGNFHAPVYAIKKGFDKYWYPDATRFIGYNPDTNDKTIHEFPSYSFIVSDLHAHLLDLPVVLMFLAFLANFIFSEDDKKKNLYILAPLGIILGVMFATSTWDFGIYLMVSGFAFAFYYLKKKGISLEFLFKTIKPLVVILILGIISALPFIFHFTSIAEGVDFVKAHTPLWQLAILWGFPAILTISFLIYLLTKGAVSRVEIFVLALLAASWSLIALPEIIYVKDIYIGSYHRANTMFKLTYQAFVMFYLTSGFIFVSVLLSIKPKFLKILASLISSLIISSLLIYPYFGIKSFYGELKNYRGLNGETWLLKEYPQISQVIDWLRENVKGQPVILEAPGDSYTDFNVISSYTGLPTVSGWFVHEWLWRGTAQVPQDRVTTIKNIYETKNLKEAQNLLAEIKVTYVIVGAFEKEKFPALYEEKFKVIGKLVFSNGGTRIYQIPNYN